MVTDSFIANIEKSLDKMYNHSVTENGAIGYKTTRSHLLDMNFKVSSYRNLSDKEIQRDFLQAYIENPIAAMRWLFFVRDIRGGLGERRLFRQCMRHLIIAEPKVIKALLPHIAEYGRYDDIVDIFAAIQEKKTFEPLTEFQTQLDDIQKDLINLIDVQLRTDFKNMNNGDSISLLAKWLPSENASSKKTKTLARLLMKELRFPAKRYRKRLSSLRQYLNIVETKMSKKQWGKIDYSAVPSQANLRYNRAFWRNDSERRKDFLESLSKGEETINAGTLFPHDIVAAYGHIQNLYSWNRLEVPIDNTLEALWKGLPDYVNNEGSTLVVADGSGSMAARIGKTKTTALEVANGLAVYFAERAAGQFKDKYITFSKSPQLVDLSSATSLRDKLTIAFKHNEISNTNIEAVFDLILTTATKSKMPQSELPKTILILSDMEFDMGVTSSGTNPIMFENMAAKYAENGYQLPKLVFWNILSRSNTIPLRENENGVALVSGFSPAVLKMVLSSELDPYKVMLEAINQPRYDIIEEAIKEVVRR